MSKLYMINDTHLGVRRQSGTTPESRAALSEFMYQQFSQLLALTQGNDLMILGDLFDCYQVSKKDEIRVYQLLSQWQRDNPQQRLILVAGNHDLSRNSKDISSFENLCTYLTHQSHHGTQMVMGEIGYLPEYHTAIVPHLPNQALFDDAIESLFQLPDLAYVCFHCNYDNHFAQQSDHSLNLSAEVAQRFAQQHTHLIFAHEHQQRDFSHVHIIGNQIPSSIADCLGNTSKRLAYLENNELYYQTVLTLSELYSEHDWQNDALPHTPFIRLTGTAEYEQAVEVIQRIAHIRKQSSAWVVSNAVQIGTLASETHLPSLESLDVQHMVAQALPPALTQRFQEVVQFSELKSS